MRELTIHELDAQVAEQLPARELMGRYCGTRSYCPHQVSGTTVNQGNFGSGNYNGNGNGNGLISVLSGNLDGNGNGNSVNVIA
jgi:hypothetical protein